MLDLLRLFTAKAPAWRADRIARSLHVSNATAYRYIKQLQRAGLIDSSGGYYTLGPALVEFDRLIRLADPMLKAAVPRMQRLRSEIGAVKVVQLWRCYRDCVVLVHAHPDSASNGNDERGRVVSLFQGAPSQVILSALPIHVQRRLFRKRTVEITKARLGRTWRDFCLRLRAMHGTGWCSARSVVRARRVAVASAIYADGVVLGSLSVELAAGRSSRAVEAIGARVHAMAQQIAKSTRYVKPKK